MMLRSAQGPDPLRPWESAELLASAIARTPNDGTEFSIRDGLEEPHALEISQVNAAQVLALCGSTDVNRPTRS